MSNTYSKKTRIGNYFEDLQLEETRIKEYLAKKERGDLHVVRINASLGAHLTPAVLSRPCPSTGGIRFGSTVMLFSHASNGSLSTDATPQGPHGTSNSGDLTLRPAQCSLDNNPYVRSAFTIAPPPLRAPVAMSNARPGGTGVNAGGLGASARAKAAGATGGAMSLRTEDMPYDVLRFGQRFQLVSHQPEPGAKGGGDGKRNPKPWYLFSTAKSLLHSSRVTDRQLVAFHDRSEWRTVWQVLPIRASDRVALDGEPVPSDEAVILNHCASNMHLLSDGKVFRTMLGNEVEVVCGKVLNEHRAERDVHFFSFVLADDDEEVLDDGGNYQ